MDYSVYSNGHLKSAIQKFVRRGMAEEAAATACVLARRGFPLFRRLPIIAAEDVGWEFVMPLFVGCQELVGQGALSGRLLDVGLEAVARLVRALALSLKDRDCGGLAGLGAISNRDEALKPCLGLLRTAIESKDALLAMRHCERFVADRRRRWVWDHFRAIVRAHGGATERHVEAIRGESYLGVLPGDELILMAAAIFAMTGLKPERQFEWRSFDSSVPEPTTWLPWYAFDMHTREGGEARVELRREGVDVEWLDASWWYWESALVNVEIGQLASRERDARGFGEETRAGWDRCRGRVRQAVEAAMRRNGLPVADF